MKSQKNTYILSKPKKASRGKTGLWRFSRPVISKDECTQCLLCWIYCPENAVDRDEEGNPTIDYEYCKGCGICANECPADAIRIEEEKV
ncbi:ferredoxin [candidate division MSBL1 archaeon SCGC-AAA259I09]|uniref:Ferredoxin n=1 Tax=candidate division MSBL1 archaeon SCGC-AAA259I09 TaxID=1698267 RepID=A0A133URZ2_9EURY|nr:ferredoxin [candidate division MSBL1 archaeon SCGC-AAA259I09]